MKMRKLEKATGYIVNIGIAATIGSCLTFQLVFILTVLFN